MEEQAMSRDIRLPGESFDDFLRRSTKDPAFPATKGPRFAGESWEAYCRRLEAADGLIDIDEQYPETGSGPDYA
jgi:hypothetical protein